MRGDTSKIFPRIHVVCQRCVRLRLQPRVPDQKLLEKSCEGSWSTKGLAERGSRHRIGAPVQKQAYHLDVVVVADLPKTDLTNVGSSVQKQLCDVRAPAPGAANSGGLPLPVGTAIQKNFSEGQKPSSIAI